MFTTSSRFRGLRNLSYEEVVALRNIEASCPGGIQTQDLPVPGKPGHYYPRETLDYLQRKMSRRH